MKSNLHTMVSVGFLKKMENDIKQLLGHSHIWETLDVDYFPPRVERLYTSIDDFRVYLHVIHKTDEKCLYHKHRWPAAFKQVKGAYEMGITYSEAEIKSEDAHTLPTLAKFILNEGSYYEMTQTDCLHYVKPISDVSLSIMITQEFYPEAVFRKEVVDRKLEKLSDARRQEILEMFKISM